MPNMFEHCRTVTCLSQSLSLTKIADSFFYIKLDYWQYLRIKLCGKFCPNFVTATALKGKIIFALSPNMFTFAEHIVTRKV